jgi:threonine dehydrogenase-like Zn-dependent dehydrogenase
VGCEVDDLRPGDRVFAMGGHCSHSRFPRREVLPVPPGLAPETAVLARLMGVSMSTLTTTTARPPARVLVTGLGLVGNLAAQIFAACGYEVIACEPSAARRELARSVGIAGVLPAVPLDDPAVRGEVDLVVECSGHEQAALDGARCVRQRGEVVLVGAPWRRRTDLSAHELLDAVFHNYAVLRSGWEWEVPLHAAAFGSGSIFAQYAAALRWLADGRIETGGLCEVRSPRQIQEAYQDLLHDRCRALSVVLDWAGLA